MSAYGAIVRSHSDVHIAPLPTTFWDLPRKSGETAAQPFVTIHHLTLSAAKSLDGLIEYLGAVMAKEIEDGMTYPQETMALDAFESYFFSGDVFLAILPSGSNGGPEGTETNLTIEEARQDRPWEDCVVGFYYVGLFNFYVLSSKS